MNRELRVSLFRKGRLPEITHDNTTEFSRVLNPKRYHTVAGEHDAERDFSSSRFDHRADAGIANAETYDVIVEPRDDRAYTIFAQAFDRSGYARGTLAPAIGISAAVPRLDSRPLRTMVDMGMAMSGMKMGPMNMSHSSPSLDPFAESGLYDPDMKTDEPAMDGMKGHSTMYRLPTIADSEAAYPETDLRIIP